VLPLTGFLFFTYEYYEFFNVKLLLAVSIILFLQGLGSFKVLQTDSFLILISLIDISIRGGSS
jgi:hypothetical protein